MEFLNSNTMWAPMGARTLTSIAGLQKWRFSWLDVKLAFLQTSAEEESVSIILSHESTDRSKYF